MPQHVSKVPADPESRNLGVMQGVCVCLCVCACVCVCVVYSGKQSGDEIRIILVCKLKEKQQVRHKYLLSEESEEDGKTCPLLFRLVLHISQIYLLWLISLAVF